MHELNTDKIKHSLIQSSIIWQIRHTRLERNLLDLAMFELKKEII